MSRYHRALDRRKWAIARIRCLNRANWTCVDCGRYAKYADHIIPLQHGGDAYEQSNLAARCRKCHHEKTMREYAETHPRFAAKLKWRALLDL